MEKRELTKALLAESFRDLVQEKPFDKITVRMITDSAGVIRPTFYHYFQDKYEVIEWLFEEQVAKPVREMVEDGKFGKAAMELFTKIGEDRKYYRKILDITGQNSFVEVLNEKVYEILYAYIHAHRNQSIRLPAGLNDALISKYYTLITVEIIIEWIRSDEENANVADLLEAYSFLLRHSIDSIVDL